MKGPNVAKSTEEAYNPQSDSMKHDSVFVDLVPNVASSGNMAHKWYPESDHTCGEEPPSGLKGD